MTKVEYVLINSRRHIANTRKRVGGMIAEAERLSAQARIAAACNLSDDTLRQELTRRAAAVLRHAKTSCDLAGISFAELLAEHRPDAQRRTS